jgi:sugar lactone lactonase YvrE
MTELLVLNLRLRLLQAVALDGSSVRTVLTGLDEMPDGVVVDHQNGHVYWTNMGKSDGGAVTGEPNFFTRNGSIERVDLDGGNRQTVVPRGTFTTGKQLTADFAERKLYWCDREGMQVLRCDLDGSNVEALVVTGEGEDNLDARNHCVGIAVDTTERMLYWTQKGPPDAGQGRILRAPIDIPTGHTASDRDDVETLWDALPEPIDLDLASDGHLVWTDRGAEPLGNTVNRARVKPQVGTPQICSRGYAEAIGLTTADDVTYYVSDLGGSIRAVNLADGTDRKLVDLGPGLTGIALTD